MMPVDQLREFFITLDNVLAPPMSDLRPGSCLRYQLELNRFHVYSLRSQARRRLHDATAVNHTRFGFF